MPGGFIYGADINEFETLETADDVAVHMWYVHSLFNRIEALTAPSCVGVDGIAVGGGLEIALVFDRLFVTSSQNKGFQRSTSASCQAMVAPGEPTAGLAQKRYWT